MSGFDFGLDWDALSTQAKAMIDFLADSNFGILLNVVFGSLIAAGGALILFDISSNKKE